jgi:hypothetical protein
MERTAVTVPEDDFFVLSSLPPSRTQKQLAFVFVLGLLVVFVLIAVGPLSGIHLSRVDAFVPAYATAMFVNDSITAILLYTQFSILRSRATLLIASGYLFTALMLIPFVLAFPGLFTPEGGLVGGMQSTSWIYFFQHAGFPLFVIGYALSKGSGNGNGRMKDVVNQPFASAALAFLATFWAGLLAGVSFLATPVEFQAVSLSLPVALVVGKVTFWSFSWAEWGLALLLAGFAVFSRGSRLALVSAALVAMIIALEALWLLPVLDARVDAVIAGTPLPPSSHHMLYAAAEGTKLLLLCVVALTSLYRLGWVPSPVRTRNQQDASHSSDGLRAQDADLPGDPPRSTMPGNRRGSGIRNLAQSPAQSSAQTRAAGLPDHRPGAHWGHSTRAAAGGHQLG